MEEPGRKKTHHMCLPYGFRINSLTVDLINCIIVHNSITSEYLMAGDIDRVFSPLNAIDVKTLSNIAGEFKKSKNQTKRAIGVFLDRANVFRSQGISGSAGSPVKTVKKFSELRDLD